MTTASMHEEMVEVLGGRIVRGELAPQSVMSLAGLTIEFGVSRTVAREAMRALQGLGLITPRRRVGIVVTSAEHWNVLASQVIRWSLSGARRDEQLVALMDLRIAIEPIAAGLAAANATDEQRARLITLVGLLRDAGDSGLGDSPEYLDADVEFHVTLLLASGNPFLRALIPAITEVLTGRTSLGLTPAHPNPLAMAYHIGVSRAVSEGNVRAAEESCRMMLSLVRDEMR